MRSPEAIQPQANVEHIVSVLLYSLPSQMGIVGERIQQHPLIDCEIKNELGKWVLVLTAHDDRQIRETMDELSHWPGVLSVSLIAHYTGDIDELNQPVESLKENDE